jgi:hypothetical protein
MLADHLFMRWPPPGLMGVRGNDVHCSLLSPTSIANIKPPRGNKRFSSVYMNRGPIFVDHLGIRYLIVLPIFRMRSKTGSRGAWEDFSSPKGAPAINENGVRSHREYWSCFPPSKRGSCHRCSISFHLGDNDVREGGNDDVSVVFSSSSHLQKVRETIQND